MLHKKVTMLTRIVIFSSVLSLTISEEISPSLLAQRKNISIPSNQTLFINTTKRVEPVSINVSDLLRKYAKVLSNSSGTSFSSSGKKAYIQDESQTAAPGITLNQLGNGIFDSGPNGNIFGQVTVTDLVPYIVQNVLSPLIQRVIIDGNLVNNVYSLWRGVSEEAATQPPAPAPAQTLPASAPPNHFVVGAVEVAGEEKTTPKSSSPPKRRRTRGSTTTTEKSSTSSSSGKGDVTEGSRQAEAESITTSKSKYKLISRTRTRPSSTTQQPFEDNQDDEDESQIFHKLSHL